MNKQAIDWSVPQRQDGSALLILMLKSVIEMMKSFWPLIIALLFTGKSNLQNRVVIFALAFLIFALVRSLLEFYFFRFQIVNNELVIRKGILNKKTIVLPLERIIAVHIEQTWLHRIINAAQVSFDSAGTEKTEVTINAIHIRKAEALKQIISETRPFTTIKDLQVVPQSAQPLITLSGNDLLKLCISANHIEGLFLLLAFGISLVDNIGEATGSEASGILAWLYDKADITTISGILFLISFFILVSITISSVRILLRYSNFRIVRSERGFSIRHGLITTKEKLVPFRKIQYLSWKATWLREKLGVFLLHFHAAGTNEMKERLEVKVPATQKKFITEILKDYHGLLPVSELTPLRIDRTYITRTILIRGMLPSLVLFSVLWFFISWNASWCFLLIPYAALQGWLFRRKFRLWIIPEALQIKKGIFGTEKAILIWNKIQAIHFNQSLYQRRKNLATLKLFTAGGTIHIPFVKEEEALKIYNYALFKVESENRPWM